MLLKIVLDDEYKFSCWDVVNPSNENVISALTSVSVGCVVILNLCEDSADHLVLCSKGDHDDFLEALNSYDESGCVVAKIHYNEIHN
ncbi:hypothetical protein HPMBJEAJ_00321 [Aeromonas phage avDM6]|nr:hypothetical protein HPMBJEAJ_00321 [Aeromonas phage avDM6]